MVCSSTHEKTKIVVRQFFLDHFGGAISETSGSMSELNKICVDDPDFVKEDEESSNGGASSGSQLIVLDHIEHLKDDDHYNVYDPKDEPQFDIFLRVLEITKPIKSVFNMLSQ